MNADLLSGNGTPTNQNYDQSQAATTVVVVTGATPLAPAATRSLPARLTIIAADGGLDHALAAGWAPDHLVGDLDSVTSHGRDWAQQHATIETYPPEKDRTDTELALAAAADLNPDRLVLIAGGGDRIDHTIAALGALGHRALTSIPVVEAWWGEQRFIVLHGPGRLTITAVTAGDTLSILAAHGACEDVTVEGVKWPLRQHHLDPLVGLGISNIVTEDPVTVSVARGVLTVALPPLDEPSNAVVIPR